MGDSGERLSRAAVDISAILSNNGTKHGMFGGWAIHRLGGHRATKDIDCLAAIGKDDLLVLMRGQQQQKSWTVIPNMREDYAPFFWDDHLKKPVLVEIFIGRYYKQYNHLPGRAVRAELSFADTPTYLLTPGSTGSPASTENAIRGMQAIQTQSILVNGKPVQLLDVVHIFKGKLQAAADRQKLSDAMDLEYLVNWHGEYLRAHASQFSRRDVGKAVERYPQLAAVLSHIQLDVAQAQQTQPGGMMSPPPFDVQRGIID